MPVAMSMVESLEVALRAEPEKDPVKAEAEPMVARMAQAENFILFQLIG